jgi:hypothetical protein
MMKLLILIYALNIGKIVRLLDLYNWFCFLVILILINWCVFVLLHVISLEDAYETLRVFKILAIQKKPLDTADTCKKVLENLGSSSPLKDVFYALKVNGILKCNVDAAIFKVLILCFFHGHYCYCFVAHLVWLLLVCWKLKLLLFIFVKDIASRLKATVNDASTLLDIYYSVGSLVLIKVIFGFLLYFLST